MENLGLGLDSFGAGGSAPSSSGSMLGISRSDKHFASKTNAALARRDWADYKEKFMPIHGVFKEAVMGTGLVNQQLARVPGNVEQSFSNARKATDMRMNHMGLDSADMGRTDLSMALSQAGAENNIRQHSKDRQMAAIAGAPMPTAGS